MASRPMNPRQRGIASARRDISPVVFFVRRSAARLALLFALVTILPTLARADLWVLKKGTGNGYYNDGYGAILRFDEASGRRASPALGVTNNEGLYSMCLASDGYLYVAGNSMGPYGWRFTRAGEYLGTWGFGPGLSGALTPGPDGKIYFESSVWDGSKYHAGVYTIVPGVPAAAATFIANGVGGLNSPVSLAFAPDGML